MTKFELNSWSWTLPKELLQLGENLADRVEKERANVTVCPEHKNLFRALQLTSIGNVKVVILGQDPYPNPEFADGLAFSARGVEKKKIPHSLRNIFKERDRDFGKGTYNPDLSRWAKQGVLLLNTSLSVEAKKTNTHKHFWEQYTNELIHAISECRWNLVFLLWGNQARSKQYLIDDTKHTILQTSHPSTLLAHKGFLGCSHFTTTNKALARIGKIPIDWK